MRISGAVSGWRLWCGVFGLASVSPWSAAQGQVRLEVAPFIGAYSSFTSYGRQYAEFPGISAGESSQRGAFALGAEASVWPTDGLGVGFHAMTSSSDPQAVGLGGALPKLDGRLSVYGAHILVRLPGEMPSFRGYVTAGPTLVSRSGEAFRGLSGTSSLGGSFGVGSYYPVASAVSLRGDIRALVYSLKLRGGTDYVYPATTQLDLTIRLGVAIDLTEQVGN